MSSKARQSFLVVPVDSQLGNLEIESRSLYRSSPARVSGADREQLHMNADNVPHLQQCCESVVSMTSAFLARMANRMRAIIKEEV